MKFKEIEQRVANVGNSSDAATLVEELLSQTGEFGLDKTQQVAIIRATFLTILEFCVRDNRMTKLHPGHLAELLDQPAPVEITRWNEEKYDYNKNCKR